MTHFLVKVKRMEDSYGLVCVPHPRAPPPHPHEKHVLNPNSQCLWMWPFLETESLLMSSGEDEVIGGSSFIATGVLVRGGKCHVKTETFNKWKHVAGRHWSALSRRTPGATGQKRQRRILPWRLQREPGPANTWLQILTSSTVRD